MFLHIILKRESTDESHHTHTGEDVDKENNDECDATSTHHNFNTIYSPNYDINFKDNTLHHISSQTATTMNIAPPHFISRG